ncbi:MAG: ABC transporter ATP-binding protein, partial [Vicinamibacteria bacterium]
MHSARKLQANSFQADAAAAEQTGRPAADVLAIEGVGLIYKTKRGSITALKDLTFDVREGEFVSVVGPSGCGKSTLLKIVAGLNLPTAGTVTLRGMPIAGPRSDIGFVFQKPSLMPWKSVLNNVLVTTRALRMDPGEARDRALKLLRMVGLEGFIDDYPGELSGGMQQRVGLVRGLVHDPSLLLMDEPFAALDAMTREHMALELQQLWMSTRKSVIFITHSIP